MPSIDAEQPLGGWASRPAHATRHYYQRNTSTGPLLYKTLCGRYTVGRAIVPYLSSVHHRLVDCKTCARLLANPLTN
ncbi:hypothetical protein [Hymenobacter latericus]|uniref:hypothetical protein n=1 Tax=Hymenobacter sp. YIM 151858-1 TaxID=2987688 RepID=UPI0022272D41|nr:hypothetical protein [Hymenobacter sp. YIM 151858-1]UYZ60076.1 hypothetical protein OIS50_04570 [Hymenobacter sp. YIM 151858-1]